METKITGLSREQLITMWKAVKFQLETNLQELEKGNGILFPHQQADLMQAMIILAENIDSIDTKTNLDKSQLKLITNETQE